MPHPQSYDGLPGLASVVLLGTSASEIVRAAIAPPFPALCDAASVTLRVFLAVLWLFAAVALTVRARAPDDPSVVWAGRIAWGTLAGYGLAETVLRVGDGSVHLVAAMIAAAAVERATTILDERDRPFPRA